MAVHYVPAQGLFQLDTNETSYMFRVFDHGYLLNVYYGRRLRTADLTRLWQPCPSGFSPKYAGAASNAYSLDLIPTEYPVYGGGDFRSPAVQVAFPNGSRLMDLTYHSHTIRDGSPDLPGLPHLDGADQTLEITLRDAQSGLEVILSYKVFESCDVIARSARIVNHTGQTVRVLRALSLSLDLPEAGYEMIGLYGAHARERQIDRTPLRHGLQSVESRRGASSHQHNPFLALVTPETTEDSGEAYGAALLYSGNFLALAEVDQSETTRMQIGINPFAFEWKLEDGACFDTPEAVLTYSREGLGRMSRQFHAAFRAHLGHGMGRREPRPIVINNWEATYFRFDQAKLFEIIDSCRGLGIDTFVLDDGWFGHRDNDTTSLGDWFVDRRKLPDGLDPIIERCRQNGMQFGLWFEPEMISEDSELYAAHPDWCIREPGRPYCLGRQQLVLDLSREDVLAYLQQAVGDVLRAHDIRYVKWDMNRHITDAYSAVLPADRQPEIYHRYITNLYQLLSYLTATFPDVRFEGCSGGGGRFDAGMLAYMPQTWTSDNSDAIDRLRIQYGTSLVYPPESMTAHVSAVPNHQVGRVTPFQTRALVAMSASFGYELNPLALTEEERAQIAEQTAQYRRIAPLIVEGDFYRLIDPFQTDACAWMLVSPDRRRAFAVYVQQRCTVNRPGPRLTLRGLDPAARYRIEELDAVYNGDELLYAGLRMPWLKDYEARSFTLERVDG